MCQKLFNEEFFNQIRSGKLKEENQPRMPKYQKKLGMEETFKSRKKEF